MTEQFYTILTKVGKAKIANSTALGTKLNLVKFQLGDANGIYYNPTEDQNQLKNKVWEGNISSITVDKENPNWIIIQTLLPSSIGGFMIREAAVIDEDNDIIAIGKYPETYKPVAENGSTKDLVIKMILEISNSKSVTLKIDPTIILTTKKDLIDSQKNLEEKLDKKYMQTSIYDKNNNGIVDVAEDAKKLNGIDSSEYVKKTEINTLQVKTAKIADELKGVPTKQIVRYDDGNTYISFKVNKNTGSNAWRTGLCEGTTFQDLGAALDYCSRIARFTNCPCVITLETDTVINNSSNYIRHPRVSIKGNNHIIKCDNTLYIDSGYFSMNEVEFHGAIEMEKSFITLEKVICEPTAIFTNVLNFSQSNANISFLTIKNANMTGLRVTNGSICYLSKSKFINNSVGIEADASIVLQNSITYDSCTAQSKTSNGGKIY